MYGLVTVTVLHIALSSTSGSKYQEAYNRAEKAGKPLLVLVGTDRSPDCRVMQQQTMPELHRAGALENLVFVAVDSEDSPALTRQLLRGDSLPQLVLYTPVGKLWRRTHLSGEQSQSEILAYLQREIVRGQEVAQKASKDKTTVSDSQSQIIFSYSSGGS